MQLNNDIQTNGSTSALLLQSNCCVQPFRVLNLYACLGGNRLLWDNCHVTAVELDEELARLYQERFPNDIVIVGDAHQFLLDHYKEFDFIWSSPPCPDNSRARYWKSLNESTNIKPVYADLRLYQEYILLEKYFDGKFCIENVIPYYEPLIPGQKRGRHIYWTNFRLPESINERTFQFGCNDEVKKLCEFHAYDFYQYKGEQRIDKIARNLVDYEAGKTIFNIARGIIEKPKSNQAALFG
jgi:DNA (cytosine-5)-methyltransferase 1